MKLYEHIYPFIVALQWNRVNLDQLQKWFHEYEIYPDPLKLDGLIIRGKGNYLFLREGDWLIRMKGTGHRRHEEFVTTMSKEHFEFTYREVVDPVIRSAAAPLYGDRSIKYEGVDFDKQDFIQGLNFDYLIDQKRLACEGDDGPIAVPTPETDEP